MSPRILLVLTLAAPLALSAQYATIGPNGQIAPAGSTVIVVGSGTGPILTTPSVSFGAPAGTAGISLADRAGISNATPTTSSVPGTPESFPVYSNTNAPYAGGQPVNGDSVAVAGANSAGRLISVGPSYYAGAGFVGSSAGGPAGAAAENAGSASLGDVAAKYKSNRPQNIRTYTNADAQRLSDSVNVHGANLNPTAAQSAVPTIPQTLQSGASGAAPQLSASMRPSPAIRDETAQSGASPQPGTAAPSNEQSATMPPTAQSSSSAGRNEQETGNRLPATSTLLPLFGLLGIASGALGLWLKKYRG